MIDLLLEAESALSLGLLDRAEILYRQVAGADPRNSIAVVGLARVLLERGDELGALKLARRALAIDAENTAAQRMVQRLEEVLEHRRSEALAEAVLPDPTPAAGAASASEARSQAPVPTHIPAAPGEPPQETQTGPAAADPSLAPPKTTHEERRPRTFISRLLRRGHD